MSILISDDAKLLAILGSSMSDGKVWLTIPALGEAVGPIPFAEYLGHQTKIHSVPLLAALEAKRIDPATLPPFRIAGEEE
jgi:hypothetical protein